jgi:hypothetical protein
MLKDSQRHKNLNADGFQPNYIEAYDMATQNYFDALEMWMWEQQNNEAP